MAVPSKSIYLMARNSLVVHYHHGYLASLNGPVFLIPHSEIGWEQWKGAEVAEQSLTGCGAWVKHASNRISYPEIRMICVNEDCTQEMRSSLGHDRYTE